MNTPFFTTTYRSAKWKAGSCLFLTIIADFLFFNHHIGWTAGLFIWFALGCMVLHNAHILRTPLGKTLTLLLIGQSFILIENPNPLSVTLTLCGCVALGIISRHSAYQKVSSWLAALCFFFLDGTIRIGNDMHVLYNLKRHKKNSGTCVRWLKNWSLPLLSIGIFTTLFTQANALLSQWTNLIEFGFLWRNISIARVCFWGWMFCIAWIFIRPRISHYLPKAKPVNATTNNKPNTPLDWLFSYDAVLRALIVCNGMFLFQTGTDMIYLWGGVTLPEGVSHAEYAQRGAYPLIFTVLLAAAFVLIALRKGSPTEKSTVIHGLIYAWIGQNILLVCSAMLRLKLYVDVYSLTQLRLAAFIWMATICGGLTLIIIRMVKQRSSTWLINWNTILSLYVLYLCSATDMNKIIADYNVAHCRETTHNGAFIDMQYMSRLGTSALPALQTLLPHLSDRSERYVKVKNLITTLSEEMDYQESNWRAWTWRNHRLYDQYLLNTNTNNE